MKDQDFKEKINDILSESNMSEACLNCVNLMVAFTKIVSLIVVEVEERLEKEERE